MNLMGVLTVTPKPFECVNNCFRDESEEAKHRLDQYRPQSGVGDVQSTFVGDMGVAAGRSS